MWNRSAIKNNKEFLKKNNLPDHFCILPWVGLETRTDAKACVCCVMQEPLDDIDLSKHTISDAWKSSHLQEIRKSFLSGNPRESCNNCWHEEHSGIISKREMELYRYRNVINKKIKNHPYPAYLDLKLGNICNSACRICSGFASSKWASDDIKLGNVKSKIFLKKGNWPRANKLFWEDLSNNITNLTEIEFFGGEPLLIKEHISILQECIDQKVANKIELSYNTNGTIYNEELIKLWKHFKYVQLLFSIDGIGNKFDYLRYPAKWTDVEKNIFKYKDNVKIGIFCTISAFNIWYMDEVCDWHATVLPDTEIHFNKVFEPKHYSPKCFPRSIKNKIIDHYKSSKHLTTIKPWLDFMFTEDYDCWDKHIKYRNLYDNERNQNYKNIFPEFYKITNEK